MREILFKAKRIDNGEWVEGYYCLTTTYAGKSTRKSVIIVESDLCNHCLWTNDDALEVYEVDSNTICQYTGLTDRNGNKIWENDVVKFEDCEMSTESGYGDCFVNVGKIAYDTDTMSYFITDRITVDMEDMDIKNDIEVIGNAFDNTELIEECD